MKVIDLLNKIANGEEVPKKIYCFNREFYLRENTYFGDTFTLMHYIQEEDLNDTVEILEEKEICHKCHKYPAEYNQTYCEFCLGISKLEEEKKIPEKLKIEQDTPSSNYYIRNENGTKCGLTKHSKMIAETLNQLIDYLKSKGDE